RGARARARRGLARLPGEGALERLPRARADDTVGREPLRVLKRLCCGLGGGAEGSVRSQLCLGRAGEREPAIELVLPGDDVLSLRAEREVGPAGRRLRLDELLQRREQRLAIGD